MVGKCKISECAAPDLPCHLGNEDLINCPNFVEQTVEKKVRRGKDVSEQENTVIPWSGEALFTKELHIVSSRSSPILFGIVGKADAGKTSFLGMVYTLLLNGRMLKGFKFSGTRTIEGWDQLHHRLRLRKGSVSFPPPTPVSSNRIYHLALRQDNTLRDVLFSDASGEVFSTWAINRDDDNAEIARWVYKNSNGFMLFIDCEALAKEKNVAKREIMLIARQLLHDLKERPVIAVWSKADKLPDVLPNLKDTIKQELKALFPIYNKIEVSNFLEPGPDEIVHENNFAVIDWLLEKSIQPSDLELRVDPVLTNDLFLNYRGHE